MCETKILEPLLTNGNYPFSQQYFHTQAKKKIQSSKNLKENGDISFSEYLNFLILDESTNILNLKSKFTKPHIFLKWNPKNINPNAFSICVIHLWFANTNIQFILDPYAAVTYYTSYMIKI